MTETATIRALDNTDPRNILRLTDRQLWVLLAETGLGIAVLTDLPLAVFERHISRLPQPMALLAFANGYPRREDMPVDQLKDVAALKRMHDSIAEVREILTASCKAAWPRYNPPLPNHPVEETTER